MKQCLTHLFFTLLLVSSCSHSKGSYYAQYDLDKSGKAASFSTVAETERNSKLIRNGGCQQIKSLVVIDPGHGGDDYGTHSSGKPKFHEKYLNLSTARQVQTFLQSFGHTVVMTRTDDTFIPLDKRASFANARSPTLFVSIHYNSAPSPDAEGIEVFYYRTESDKERASSSKQLAQAILDKTVRNTKARSRGVKHGNYAVLRQTEMPAALIEGGFLTNKGEMDKIKDAAYMKQLALGIAQGIDSYLAKEKVLAAIKK